MTEFLKTLNNARQLKRQLKPLSATQISAIIEKMMTCHEEKVEEEKQLAEQQAKEAQELKAAQQYLLENNINFDKLASMMGQPQTSKKRVKAQSMTSTSEKTAPSSDLGNEKKTPSADLEKSQHDASASIEETKNPAHTSHEAMTKNVTA